MSDFVDRAIRAAKLDVTLYEEVEADENAISQALIVVVLASVASGIGMIGKAGAIGIFTGTLMHLIGWFVWAFVIFFVGTKLMPEPETKSNMGELLRTIGFASSPLILNVIAFIPYLGGLIRFGTGIWALVAMVIAVRHALDYKTTGKAVLVCIIGLIPYLIVLFILAAILGLGRSII